MENAKYFDIQDGSIPAIVYFLVPCLVNIYGNDKVYELSQVFDWRGYQDPYVIKAWDKVIEEKALNRCFCGDQDELKEVYKNETTYEQAMEFFIKWLESQGVTHEDTLIVKWWW